MNVYKYIFYINILPMQTLATLRPVFFLPGGLPEMSGRPAGNSQPLSWQGGVWPRSMQRALGVCKEAGPRGERGEITPPWTSSASELGELVQECPGVRELRTPILRSQASDLHLWALPAPRHPSLVAWGGQDLAPAFPASPLCEQCSSHALQHHPLPPTCPQRSPPRQL